MNRPEASRELAAECRRLRELDHDLAELEALVARSGERPHEKDTVIHVARMKTEYATLLLVDMQNRMARGQDWEIYREDLRQTLDNISTHVDKLRHESPPPPSEATAQ